MPGVAGSLSTEEVRRQVADLERLFQEEYKPAHPPKTRDWRTYEQQLERRTRTVMRDLGPLVREACRIARVRGSGPEPRLTLEQKVTLLLLKILYEQSNRRMAFSLVAFSLLSGLEVSYKTVERLYSDPEVAVALSNLHRLMLERRGVRVVDATGDGTGFALSITQHYATTATKEKERAKENPPEGTAPIGRKAKGFVYSFRLLDLRTWLYVAYGTSRKSEREAYDAALAWLKVQRIKVRSIRLDRYYSGPSDAEKFPGAAFYILPKKNARVRLQPEWYRALQQFVERPLEYLEAFYQREHSEAGFSADKRGLGWGIAQRRPERIEMADRGHSTWHNLLNLYGPDRTPLVGPSG